MNDFESLKKASYQLITEYIEKNSADVATSAVIDIVEKLLAAKDMQVEKLATEKATKILNKMLDKATEQLHIIPAQIFLAFFEFCQ